MMSSSKEEETERELPPNMVRLPVSDPRHPWADPVIEPEENPMDFDPSYYLDVPPRVTNGSVRKPKINEDWFEKVEGIQDDVVIENGPTIPSDYLYQLFDETLHLFNKTIKDGGRSATSHIFYYRMNSAEAAKLVERAEQKGFYAEVYQSIGRQPEVLTSIYNCLYIVVYRVKKVTTTATTSNNNN